MGVLSMASIANDKYKYVVQPRDKTEFNKIVNRLSSSQHNLSKTQIMQQQELVNNAVKSLRKARFHIS